MSEHDGFYVLVDERVPTAAFGHFYLWLNEEDFINHTLSLEAIPHNAERCQRFSTFMGINVKAYIHGNRSIYFTDRLFNAEELSRFLTAYYLDVETGIRPQLLSRKKTDLKTYVDGKINLLLNSHASVNGCLEITFAEEGRDCLPFLHHARMLYCSPQPGYFTRVEVNEEIPSIVFYLE